MAGDNWWQKIYHSDAWKAIVAIVTVIVIVLAIAAFLVTGPLALLIGALLAIGSALLFADTIAAFLEGDIGPGEFGLAMALTLIPGGNAAKGGLKALTAGARAADGAADVAGAARGITAVETIGAATRSVAEGTGNVIRRGAESLGYRPYMTPGSRPSFRKGVVQTVWDRAMGPDGLVRDPHTQDVIRWIPGASRQGVWDMGHIKGQRYHDRWLEYVDGKMTPKEFRDWYNNPDNYVPELPGPNRSHLYE